MTMSVKDRLILFRHIFLTQASESAAYETWDDAFVRKNLVRAFKNEKDFKPGPIIEPVTIAEIRKLSEPDLREIGFTRWDENLWLIPLWMLNIIADGEVLRAINGTDVTKDSRFLDNDHRHGFLAYGWVPN